MSEIIQPNAMISEWFKNRLIADLVGQRKLQPCFFADRGGQDRKNFEKRSLTYRAARVSERVGRRGLSVSGKAVPVKARAFLVSPGTKANPD